MTVSLTRLPLLVATAVPHPLLFQSTQRQRQRSPPPSAPRMKAPALGTHADTCVCPRRLRRQAAVPHHCLGLLLGAMSARPLVSDPRGSPQLRDSAVLVAWSPRGRVAGPWSCQGPRAPRPLLSRLSPSPWTALPALRPVGPLPSAPPCPGLPFRVLPGRVPSAAEWLPSAPGWLPSARPGSSLVASRSTDGPLCLDGDGGPTCLGLLLAPGPSRPLCNQGTLVLVPPCRPLVGLLAEKVTACERPGPL